MCSPVTRIKTLAFRVFASHISMVDICARHGMSCWHRMFNCGLWHQEVEWGHFKPFVLSENQVFFTGSWTFSLHFAGCFSQHGGLFPAVLTSTKCTYSSWEVGLFPEAFVVTKSGFFFHRKVFNLQLYYCRLKAAISHIHILLFWRLRCNMLIKLQPKCLLDCLNFSWNRTI